ncbi:MAG: hemerythrin [Desulfobacterales bacterium S5133MH16]|nr:MAG: hemerythrin [Desulfobacterales bacterium S5133MH16]
MDLISWNPSFNVDVEVIDKQHQMLVKMINELHDSMLAGKDKDVLLEMINRLSAYAAFHFAREEHYFDIFGYPETELHKKQHSDFELKVSTFENDFTEGRQSLSIEIMNFLSDWLVGHIKGSDKKYAPFLKERGVK